MQNLKTFLGEGKTFFPKKTFSLKFTFKFFLKEAKTAEEYSPSKFYILTRNKNKTNSLQTSGHIINNLLTSLARSVWKNITPRLFCTNLAVLGPFCQDLGLGIHVNAFRIETYLLLQMISLAHKLPLSVF